MVNTVSANLDAVGVAEIGVNSVASPAVFNSASVRAAKSIIYKDLTRRC
jgi:hypothetical protein